MASDRNAKLSIQTDASSMAKAAEDAKKLRTEIGNLGDAGADAGAGLDKTADALDQVTTAETEAAAGARDLGKATEQAADEAQGFKDGVAQVQKLADSITESEIALEDQRRAITSAIAEVDKLVAAETAAGRSGQETANLATKAAEIFRGKLVEVNAAIEQESAALREMGGAGVDALGAIGDAAFTVEGTTTAAANHIEGAWEQLNDNFAITPRQLSLISQAVAATEIAIVRAGERGQAVTVDQLALYERQKASLTELTAIANRLTNASKDNAVGLKQTGAQIAGVTNGVQQLTAMLGPNASKIGMVVGNVGQLGSVMEGLQAGVKSLDLNTVSATASTAKLGIQLGAVAAVAAAAAAAGVKLANVNDQNAESTERLLKSIKKFVSGEVKEAKDQVAGLQAGLQSLAIALSEAVTQGNILASDSDDLVTALSEIALGAGRGQSSIKLYNIAIRDGVDRLEAFTLAQGDATKALKFYEDTRRGGVEGDALWRRGLKESAGDIEKLEAFIKKNSAALTQAITITEKQTAAQKLNNAAVREGIDLARIKGDEGNRLLTAEEQNVARLSAANRQLEQAQNGTTASLNQGLAVIRSMIGDSARNSEELADMAVALGEVLTNTTNLTAAERSRIEAVIELAQNGNALTESERAYAAALAQSIINGDKAVISLAARKEAADALKTAIADLVTATQAEASALDENETAIQKAVKSAEKLLASTTPLDTVERARLRTIVELGKQVDELAAAQDRLTAASAMTAQAETASGEAESSLVLVKSGKVDVIQREIDAKAEMIKALSMEKANTEALTTATQAIIKVQENGRTVYTNLTDEQRKSADATKATGDAAEKAAGQFGDVLVKRLEHGRIVITNVAQAVKETSGHVETLGVRAEEAGPKIVKGLDWSAVIPNITLVEERVRSLNELLKLLEDGSARVTQNVGAMAKAIDAAGDAATKAAGGSISYNNVTEGV